MKPPFTKARIIRTMAGEGDFYMYRLLTNGSRAFIFAKLLRISLGHWWRKNEVRKNVNSVVYIKGKNQLRLFGEARSLLEAKLEDITPLSEKKLDKSVELLPSISTAKLLIQVWFLVLMLLTGRRRHLNLYYLSLYMSLREMIQKSSLRNTKKFVCLNDQPCDVSALVLIFREIEGCIVAVLQHGVIIRSEFYFPTHAHQFWAWGEMSRQGFRASFSDGIFILTGRTLEDHSVKADHFVKWRAGGTATLVIAPSHQHSEIKTLVREVAAIRSPSIRAEFLLKLHPATRFRSYIALWAKVYFPQIRISRAPIAQLAWACDGLVTTNSTSSVDFLLRGKPVFFSVVNRSNKYPSAQYGFQIQDIPEYAMRGSAASLHHNTGRLEFIYECLNV